MGAGPVKELATQAADALHDSARLAIPLGIALITGVFVALGVEGDLLSRLLRNEPAGAGIALVCAVVGVTAPLILAGVNAAALRVVTMVAAALLALSAGLAIWVAIAATGTREQPSLDAEIVSPGPAGGQVSVKFTAEGLSLASDEKMLLRISVLNPDTTISEAHEQCGGTRSPDLPDPATGKVLFWGESGPSLSGAVSTAHTISLDPADYSYVCAYAVLSAKGADRRDFRFATTILSTSTLDTAAE